MRLLPDSSMSLHSAHSMVRHRAYIGNVRHTHACVFVHAKSLAANTHTSHGPISHGGQSIHVHVHVQYTMYMYMCTNITHDSFDTHSKPTQHNSQHSQTKLPEPMIPVVFTVKCAVCTRTCAWISVHRYRGVCTCTCTFHCPTCSSQGWAPECPILFCMCFTCVVYWVWVSFLSSLPLRLS